MVASIGVVVVAFASFDRVVVVIVAVPVGGVTVVVIVAWVVVVASFGSIVVVVVSVDGVTVVVDVTSVGGVAVVVVLVGGIIVLSCLCDAYAFTSCVQDANAGQWAASISIALPSFVSVASWNGYSTSASYSLVRNNRE